MLYPKINKSRSVISLEGLWKFKLLKDMSEFDPAAPLSDFEWISVPASYNDQKEDPAFRRFAGLSVYQKNVTIPGLYASQRLVLRFDAVCNDAVVYVNGREITKHKGGYLPFEADLTSLDVAGKEILITVLVDNRVNSSTLPVGNEKKAGAFFGSDNAQVPAVQKGKEYQKDINLPNFDFFNYAGINRPVRIYSTPLDYIEDVTIVTDVVDDAGVTLATDVGETDVENKTYEKNDTIFNNCTGVVNFEIKVFSNDKSQIPTIEILDNSGLVVATTSGLAGTIEIPSAHLWNPGKENAYLYTMRIAFGEDSYDQTFGIRTVKVEGKRFLINGKPFYFKGFGKHEDSHIHGRGFDLTLDVKDVGLIHWLNANSFRTSHYPYAEEMYDLCDREGIVIIDETTAVGIGCGGKNPYEILNIKDHHQAVLKDLIARDKNHPSVVMWSLGNEPDTENHPEAALEYWSALYKLAHETDPQNRPVTMVCCQNNYERDITTRTMDVVCLNRYYGWYNLSGDLDAAMYALNIELDFWEKQNKPVMFTEYGADAYPGIHETVPEMFSEEFQAELLLSYGDQFDKRDFIVGEQLWNFADFGTIQGPMRVDGNKKGLFTRERRPKLSAHAMRRRWKGINKYADN